MALERARAGKVRTIRFARGRYALAVPIVIDNRFSGTPDAPFTLEAAPGAKVELSGARALPALRWEATTAGVWRARLAIAPFQRLWLGDEAQVRARYPNYDPAVLPYGGVAADATSPERVARWANPAGGVLHALHGSRWGDVHVPILGKNSKGNLRYGPEVGNNRAAPPSVKERFVENIREELDAPHEWYYDAAYGYLYYKPKGSAPPPADGFRAGTAEELIRVVGTPQAPVHDVKIAGLAFRATEPTFLKTTEPLLRLDWMFHRGGAVLIADAERVTVEDGDFEDLGGNAIVVSGHARGIAIRRNLIARIGASAIAFVGKPDAVRSPLFEYSQSQPLEKIDWTPGPKTEDYPADSIAQDNLIHDIGLIEKQSAGVQIAMSARITVDHNSIYRVPRAGINVGDGTWGGHQVTNNDVFDTVRESGDHGAYNSWGRDRYWHPDRPEMDRRTMADRSLVKLDAVETIVLRNNRFQCDHGWDVDLDDGSSNYLIEGNLMLSGGLKLREGFDRVARNNILLNNSFHPHVWFDNGADLFERNIVMAAYQPIRIKFWGKSVDHNLFPSASDLKLAQVSSTDAHSLAGDPQFVAPEKGDYSVRPTSPDFARAEARLPQFRNERFRRADPAAARSGRASGLSEPRSGATSRPARDRTSVRRHDDQVCGNARRTIGGGLAEKGRRDGAGGRRQRGRREGQPASRRRHPGDRRHARCTGTGHSDRGLLNHRGAGTPLARIDYLNGVPQPEGPQGHARPAMSCFAGAAGSPHRTTRDRRAVRGHCPRDDDGGSPTVFLTRRLPAAVEARLAERFDTTAGADNRPPTREAKVRANTITRFS